MSAINELALQCGKRGWRVGIDGSYPYGRRQAGLVVNTLEVRGRDRELLAHVSCDPENLDEAAIDAARALARQGLIGDPA